jgi:hypothetical protein
MNELNSDISTLIVSLLDIPSIFCLKHTCKHFFNLEVDTGFIYISYIIHYDSESLLDYFLSLGFSPNGSTFYALWYSKVKILDYLKSKNLIEEEPYQGNYSHNIYKFTPGRTYFKVCESLKWLVNNGYELFDDVFITAARVGDLKTVKWLTESGYSIPNDIWNYTTKSNNLDLLKYLIASRPDSYEGFISNIFTYCSLEIINWLESYYTFDIKNLDSCYARRCTKLDVVEFLYNRDYSFSKEILAYNLENNDNIDVVIFLHDKIDYDMEEMFINGKDNLNFIKWYLSNGFQIPKSFNKLVLRGEVFPTIVDYLKENNILA